jgi:hypothetical protein
MPGPVPGIHALWGAPCRKDVDGRDKPGHDENGSILNFLENNPMHRTPQAPRRDANICLALFVCIAYNYLR